jgi:hypothetical protein
MKRLLLLLALVALAGCVHHVTVSTARLPGWSGRWISRINPTVLQQAPAEPFDIIGTIQLRTSRVVSGGELANELSMAAARLEADAVIPLGPEHPRELKFQSVDPLRVYFVFDDNRSQVLEGQAIRYRKAPK